ncbi:WG repeat-containing protein [Epilithonimonas hispanica]|uniref:WG repeat-containing protein n=1 Tax=Epilithonimonas hispanica TaxID=358687 RepID=A0A3D9CZM5_9FLAO|nr:WG repeat-containing protein [Epilithonimonas hispanica]REC71213.1 WG repeat-containing protein [Epilithonimonas hispanica]
MKKLFSLFILSFFGLAFSQMKDDNDTLPSLIPQKINQFSGYINQQGKVVIVPEYHIAMFFSQDCNLLNSPNKAVRVFGSANYATVEKNNISYRINKKGKRVYRYKKTDIGKCSQPYVVQKYKAFVLNGAYGLVSKEDIDLGGYKDFDIYPQYQMLYVLESDRENPMIVAVKNDKFGIIDKNNQVVIPFIYADIKTNLSWKTANLFEVSTDGKDYFFVNKNNYAYLAKKL